MVLWYIVLVGEKYTLTSFLSPVVLLNILFSLKEVLITICLVGDYGARIPSFYLIVTLRPSRIFLLLTFYSQTGWISFASQSTWTVKLNFLR